MISPEDDTHHISRPEPDDTVQTTLELHVRRGAGGSHILPVHRTVMECLGIRFRYQNGVVEYEYGDRRGRLEVGSSVELEGARISLWDHARSTAYLKGYSDHYSGQVWPLGEGVFPVGRAGRRDNHVVLDHPTVSREHATLYSNHGRYRLLAESSTSPVLVGGVLVAPGQSVTLSPGDLIEIGELVFRFHSLSEKSSGLIRVRSLGTLQVSVGGQPLNPKSWKTQACKWLFAQLAYQWERPIGIDVVMSQLWPDFAADKAKNNFSATLSTLRTILRDALPQEFRAKEIVLRTSSTLQLDPELLETHDVVELERDLKMASSSEQQAERAVLAYTAPFLEDCYLEWVQPVRQAMELELLAAGRLLLEARAARQAWKDIVPVATQILKIDPYSSFATLYLIRALRHNMSPAEALRVFEQHKKLLQRDLGTEPEVELVKEYLLLTQSL